MTYKDLFDQTEWQTLQFAFMWVFRGVAGADGKIDKEEQVALTKVINASDKITNLFAREILKTLEVNPGQIFRLSIGDHRDYRKGLEEVAAILDAKVSFEDSLMLKKILVAVAIFVANSSGEMGGSKISDEEVQQLSKIANHLKLNMGELKKEPTVDQLLRFFV